MFRNKIDVGEADVVRLDMLDGSCHQRLPDALSLPCGVNNDIDQYRVPYPVAQYGAPRYKLTCRIKASYRCPVAGERCWIIFILTIPADCFPQVSNSANIWQGGIDGERSI